MKKLLLFAVVIAAMLAAACSKYKYETVAGDPLNTRIYTLDNGLKVYMSVNKEAPRIQTYIAVKVGGKNDPAETTGLAHYFEHLMFKGTQQFGTSDYAADRKLGQAFSSGLVGALLGIIGYTEATAFDPAVTRGIFNMACIAPIIGFVCIVLALVFLYPLSKKKVEENVAALAARRNSK